MRLVVLAADVAGRWPEEGRTLVSQLAKGKARSAPHGVCDRLTTTACTPSFLSLQQGLLLCPSWRSDLLWCVTATHRLRLRLLVLVPLDYTTRDRKNQLINK